MTPKVILTCDETLTSTYRNIPLLDFFGCAPVEKIPSPIYRLLDSQVPHNNGLLSIAPYSLRKIEAALVNGGYPETVVVHASFVTQFINRETRVVGVSAMDPLGLGPVSMMFTNGGRLTAYTKKKFTELIKRLVSYRNAKNYSFKIVVGGTGAWQLVASGDWKAMGIDHIVLGEVDAVAGEIIREIEMGNASEVIRVSRFPSSEEISPIIGPSYKGMVEVMRGCGRNCRYCDPNLRRIRHIPDEVLRKEIEINLTAGLTTAWLHSDDIFLYKLEDRREFYPNSDEVVHLFEKVMSIPGVKFSNPTHGTIAPVVADPLMIRRISQVVRAGPSKWVGIQMGLETASPSLIERYMESKAKPFSPSEWPELIVKGTQILNENYWFPAYTAIIGLPGETREDLLETARLIVTMETVLRDRIGGKAHFTVTPLSFVPAGSLKEGKAFDIEEQMTEEGYLLIYHSWKHLVREISSFIPNGGANKRLVTFYPIARMGLFAILNFMRRWGIQMGYDPDRRLEPLDIRLAAS
ncbi:MAG: B12-binding domain-containing radical SAM protein [Methanomassiliicoccales archaeon]|nr:B12-binding domain-containing radical SAM protein [Methanomassiliicoccales archaeon]